MTAHALEMLRELESAGFESKQAEAIVDIVTTRAAATYVTKAEAARLESRIEAATARLESKIAARADIARIERKTAATPRPEGRIEAAVVRLESKIDTSIAAIRADITRLESKMDKMNSRMDSIQANLTMLINMMIGIYASFFAVGWLLALNHLFG